MTTSCWKVPPSELVELTPQRARDLVVECFYFAQHETLARVKQRMGAASVDDASVRANVLGAVRLAFKETGGDFDYPSVHSLHNVIDVLAKRAGSWGTPDDIVKHHHDQILAMLGRVARHR